MQLWALGACTAITIEMYATLKKLDLTKLRVTVTETTVADPDGELDKKGVVKADSAHHRRHRSRGQPD